MIIPAVKRGVPTNCAPNYMSKTNFGLSPIKIQEKELLESGDQFVSRIHDIHKSGDMNTKIQIVGTISKKLTEIATKLEMPWGYRERGLESKASLTKKLSTLQKALDSFVNPQVSAV